MMNFLIVAQKIDRGYTLWGITLRRDREEQSRREEAAEENKPVLKSHNKRRY